MPCLTSCLRQKRLPFYACLGRVKFNGKVYRPTKFGEGMQPGTVEWELARRRAAAEKRADTIAWKKMQAQPKPDPDLRPADLGYNHPLLYPWRVLVAWIDRWIDGARKD